MFVEVAIAILIVCILFALTLHTLERLIVIDNVEAKAIVVSGCDSGFGHGIALKCAKRGMTVFAGCLSVQGCAQLENEAKQQRCRGTLICFDLDVTSEASVQKAAKLVAKHVGDRGIWGLINNAGIAGQNAWDDWCSIDDYLNCFQVNTLGVIRLTHAFKPLIKRARGRIVNMASICGRVSLPLVGPYTVSKFGVEAYSDVLRREMSMFGVDVAIIEPGFFRTNLTSPDAHTAHLERRWRGLTNDIRDEYGEHMLKHTKEQIHEQLNLISSTKTQLVVDAYFRALTVPRLLLRRRYTVGADAALLFVPLSLIHGAIADYACWAIQLVSKQPRPTAVRAQKRR